MLLVFGIFVSWPLLPPSQAWYKIKLVLESNDIPNNAQVVAANVNVLVAENSSVPLFVISASTVASLTRP